MPGLLYRSDADGLNFEEGPQIFHDNMRHLALRVSDDGLDVVYSRVGDAPERLLHSKIALEGDWRDWKPMEPKDLLRPQEDWEGVHCPIEPSLFGPADEPKHQLRDPAFFEEAGKTWLLCSVAGEAGMLVNPNDPNDIASAVLKLLTDVGLHEKKRQQGFKQVAKFSWEKAACKTFEVFEKTL